MEYSPVLPPDLRSVSVYISVPMKLTRGGVLYNLLLVWTDLTFSFSLLDRVQLMVIARMSFCHFVCLFCNHTQQKEDQWPILDHIVQSQHTLGGHLVLHQNINCPPIWFTIQKGKTIHCKHKYVQE